MHTSRALTKKVRVDGSKVGGQKFVPPVISGQVTEPFSSGSWPGRRFGRPVAKSTSFAHVVFTNGFATISLPVERVVEAVAVREHHDLARLPRNGDLAQDRNLRRVPIVQVVGRELIVPAN